MSPVPGAAEARAPKSVPSARFAVRLPAPRRILGGVYLGRMMLAAAMFLATAMVWARATPHTTLASALILVGATVFTIGSFWHSHVRDRTPGRTFLYSQALHDVLLVTAVVHLTGGADSAFAPLYILVICAAAVLLPLPGGVLIGALASSVYFADVFFASHSTVDIGVLLQVGLFTVVAVVTGYLGDRLRQTGAALGEVETELRLLRLDTGDILSSISTGILTVDGAGRLAYINPAATELLHLSAAEWLGKPILDEMDRRAPGLGSVIARSAGTRKPIRRFETDQLRDAPVVLGVSTTLMERPEDEQPPVTAIFQDITEKKRAEALRRRAERLEAVAELSASLAHEIKNPLASIRSAAEQLAAEGVDVADRDVLARLVVRESNRLSRLLTEFIDFARVKLVAPELVRVAELVDDVVQLVRAHPDAEGRRITMHEPGHEPLVVRGSTDLLHRALLNLVLNAAQWAGARGRVGIAVELVHSDILSPALGVSDIVQVTVSDTGPGVPPEMIEHIFDPFFTRRPGGTGLGLALVQRAVEAHGGAIFVDNARSREYTGASFTMYLPAADPGMPHTGTISNAA